MYVTSGERGNFFSWSVGNSWHSFLAGSHCAVFDWMSDARQKTSHWWTSRDHTNCCLSYSVPKNSSTWREYFKWIISIFMTSVILSEGRWTCIPVYNLHNRQSRGGGAGLRLRLSLFVVQISPYSAIGTKCHCRWLNIGQDKKSMYLHKNKEMKSVNIITI